MRIAFFHELHAGGARRSVNEFGKQLKKKHLVDLYYTDQKRDIAEESNFNHGYFFKFTPKLWKGKNWKARLYKDSLELYKLYLLHKKIADYANDKNYDLVFVNPSQFTQAPFLLKFLKTKSIYYCQEPLRILYDDALKIPNNNGTRMLYEKLILSIRKKIDRDNINASSVVLTNSLFTKQNIKKSYEIESILCYLGVNEKMFKPKKIDKKYDVLFVGSTKDQIDGHRLLKDVKPKIQKNKVLVVDGFKNRISDHELTKTYQESKLVLCLAYNEPFGLVPLEALSCGVPVIAVNEGGYKETIQNEKNGYLIKRDPDVLAHKIKYLLSHPSIQKKMGENGRKMVLEKWTWEKRTKELESIIKHFLKD